VERVKPVGGLVYHDVTELKWAQKAVNAGVDGLICVNNRAGGHTGTQSPEALYTSLSQFGLPLVCAGGVGDEAAYVKAMELGYSAVQMGTRFIATAQCRAHEDYKQAILRSTPEDIVLTERLTGVPVSVIRTEAVEQIGTSAGALAKWMLKHKKFKHWIRLWYSLNSLRHLKKASLQGNAYKDYWQAGKSVDGIEAIEDAQTIVKRFGTALEAARR
jgi:nitronate monooxygenase